MKSGLLRDHFLRLKTNCLSSPSPLRAVTYEAALKEDWSDRHPENRGKAKAQSQRGFVVGSIFDRLDLPDAVKNARIGITTAFGPRSSVSGIGPVVHPHSN